MFRRRLKAAFDAYTSNYDMENPNIQLKYVHTGKVAENCESIARSLQLPEKDVDLAWEIGMLHDIGRFEQLRIYDTFFDAVSVDHAQFGADLLFVEGLIGQFDPNLEEKELVECAIRNHSRYRLPEHLSEREKLFCDIIRDADKVDIYRANYETGLDIIYHVTKDELKNSRITPVVYEVFCEERAIPRNLCRTVADSLTGHIALTYELVYPRSRCLAKEQGYLKKLLHIEFANEETNEILRKMERKIDDWFERNGI